MTKIETNKQYKLKRQRIFNSKSTKIQKNKKK